MLLGASFRVESQRYHNKSRPLDAVLMPIMIILYFVSKISFSRGLLDNRLQIVNQILIFLLLFITFRFCIGRDSVLLSLPNNINRIITFVSELTLEIYLVQSFIIKKIESTAILFPVNWLIVTLLIIFSAFMLHIISERIITATIKFQI